MQLTAGSLTGRFGRRPKYWSERMLDDHMVHIIATDSHHPERRPPLLREGREAAALRIGANEAEQMVVTRPQGIINDVGPSDLLAKGFEKPKASKTSRNFWKSWFRGA